MSKKKSPKEVKPKAGKQQMDGFDISFEDAMKIIANPPKQVYTEKK